MVPPWITGSSRLELEVETCPFWLGGIEQCYPRANWKKIKRLTAAFRQTCFVMNP
jgi:hypothetical protein